MDRSIVVAAAFLFLTPIARASDSELIKACAVQIIGGPELKSIAFSRPGGRSLVVLTHPSQQVWVYENDVESFGRSDNKKGSPVATDVKSFRLAFDSPEVLVLNQSNQLGLYETGQGMPTGRPKISFGSDVQVLAASHASFSLPLSPAAVGAGWTSAHLPQTFVLAALCFPRQGEQRERIVLRLYDYPEGNGEAILRPELDITETGAPDEVFVGPTAQIATLTHGTLTLWNYSRQKATRSLNDIQSVNFSYETNQFATTNAGGQVQTWQMNGTLIRTLTPTYEVPRHFIATAYAENGGGLAGLAADGSLHVWDAHTGRVLYKPAGLASLAGSLTKERVDIALIESAGKPSVSLAVATEGGSGASLYRFPLEPILGP